MGTECNSAIAIVDIRAIGCLLLIGIATKSGDFAEQPRLYFVDQTYSYFAELENSQSNHDYSLLLQLIHSSQSCVYALVSNTCIHKWSVFFTI